jgi:hypothetical protein
MFHYLKLLSIFLIARKSTWFVNEGEPLPQGSPVQDKHA